MPTKRIVRLDAYDLAILDDVMDLVRDRLRHYPDAELGWDAEDVQRFDELDSKFYRAQEALR